MLQQSTSRLTTFQGYHICDTNESLVLSLLVLRTDISLQSINKLLQERPGRCKRNIEARSRNHCCRQRTKSITYSVALVTQYVKRIRHIMLHLWSGSLYHIFPHYFNNGTIFEKKNQYKICSGFGGLGVACWPLVPKFAGSNPAEAVGFLRAKKSSARLPSEGK